MARSNNGVVAQSQAPEECNVAKKKSQGGRPFLPKGQQQSSLLAVRLKPSERKAIERAAKKSGLTLSAWAREVLLAQT